jgi:hypothetical protein
LVAVALLVAAVVTLQGPGSSARPGLLQGIASGNIHRAVLHLRGGVKQMPFFSGGIVSTAESLTSGGAALPRFHSRGRSGFSVSSLGCADRAGRRDVRVNQDCTYRRQAEEDIAFNPTDPKNLVAGMNDSLIGWNQTSIDFSLDGGKHWGAISTAPFAYRLNAPEDLEPTADDPNRHTILGTEGSLHSYDACSDPYLAFDSRGRAFYTCVAFNIVDFASLVFVVPSPAGAKGSYFDQVYPPFGLIPPTTGREHIVEEDNSPGASADGPKLAADDYRSSPNRDNVYSTFTLFSFTCGPNGDEYCQSPVYGSMSTDHGFTWSTPEEISGNNPQVCKFGNAFDPSQDPNDCNLDGHSDIAVHPNGDLTVSFISQNSNGLNPQILDVQCQPTGSSPAGTAHLNCGTPGRVATEVLTHAPQCNFGRGPEQCSPGAFIRVPFETSQRIAVDQQTGDLFVTWYDYRFGEFDIFESRSTNGGQTWSSPRLVNPDRGTDHYFSAIDVGESRHGSHVGVSYYRTGRVPNENHTPPGGFAPGMPGVQDRPSDYAVAGGASLATPYAFRVVSPSFPPPDGIQEGFNGDYSGLVVTRGKEAHPVWSDTRVSVPDPSFDHVTVDEDVYTIGLNLPGRR